MYKNLKTIVTTLLATSLFSAPASPSSELSSYQAHPIGDFDGDGSEDLLYLFRDVNKSGAGDIGGFVIYSYKTGTSFVSQKFGYWGEDYPDFCFSHADLDGDGDSEVIVMDKVYNWSGGTSNSGN